MLERSRLGIIIPAYNEERTIGKVISSIKDKAAVIVVNDCSTDSTGKIAQDNGAHVVNHKGNKGYDGALSSGFQKAYDLNLDCVITFDADGQHDADLLDEFFGKMVNEEYDLVLGVRPEKARLSEKVMGHYLNARYGIQDALCGMKGYKMQIWREYGNRFCTFESIGTELMLSAFKSNKKVIQISIPIHMREDAPRFGRVLKGNYKIFNAFAKLAMIDLLNIHNGKW